MPTASNKIKETQKQFSSKIALQYNLEMEISQDLKTLDNQIIKIYQKYPINDHRKQINCYKLNRKQISSFYNSMTASIYAQKLKKNKNNHEGCLKKKKRKTYFIMHSNDENNENKNDNAYKMKDIDVQKIEYMDLAPMRQMHTINKHQTKGIYSQDYFDMESYCSSMLKNLKFLKISERQESKSQTSIKKFNQKFMTKNAEEKVKDLKRKLSCFKPFKTGNQPFKNAKQQQNSLKLRKSKFDKLFNNNFTQHSKILLPFKQIFFQTNGNQINEKLINYLQKFEHKSPFHRKNHFSKQSCTNINSPIANENKFIKSKSQQQLTSNALDDIKNEKCIFISKPSNVEMPKSKAQPKREVLNKKSEKDRCFTAAEKKRSKQNRYNDM